jgi:hypothetical protein
MFWRKFGKKLAKTVKKWQKVGNFELKCSLQNTFIPKQNTHNISFKEKKVNFSPIKAVTLIPDVGIRNIVDF